MATAEPLAAKADRAGRLALYRTMRTIRRTEEHLARAHQRGLIHGACHTYVGQEAVAAGVTAHLSAADVVFSTHRGHGHALAKGVTPHSLVAELFGRATGCSRGRGGSMHLFAPEVGMMGTSGIVGPCILQAAGAGYSFKVLRTDGVAVAFFGDGAVNNGAFHEGLNMAGIWKLPVLFVCENNGFATEVPFDYASGSPSVAARAASYGIPGVAVDGNDVLAVSEAAAEAVARARAGGGATLIECKTYRTRPHAEGMGDFTYRSREEVEAWKARCPIARWREALLASGEADEAELQALDEAVEAEAVQAVRDAEAAPWPDPGSAGDHVFATETPPSRPEPPPGGRVITFMKATLEALAEAMERDPTLFVMGEGIGKRGGNFATTTGLFDRFGPIRLCDTPISERGFVGMAAGAAMTGTRPVIDFMFADFVLDAVGEILNQIAKVRYMSSGRLKMPVLLRGCIGIGNSAATHHSGNYYPMFAHFPGLRVVVPSNAYDARGLLAHALTSDDPVLFLEHRGVLALKAPVPEAPYEIEFGRAAVVRAGTDVTVVALALMVHRAVEAAEVLASEGVSVEVIDPRTVAPLDVETILASVRKTGRLLIVDEAFAPYGLGAEVAARVIDAGFDDLDAPIRRLNGAHTPTPYSPPLEAAVVPGPEEIAHAVRALIAEQARPEGPRRVMPIEITIPRLGWSMEEGVFAGWLKRDGDAVRAGEPLFSLEGEKATQDVEAIDEGTLSFRPTAPVAGQTVAVGAVIGFLLAPGEVAPPPPRPTPAEAVPAPTRAANHDPEDREPPPAQSRPRSSPLARRLAREHGIDWKSLRGGGTSGRVRRADVLAAVAARGGSPPSPVGREAIPITSARRTIATRMLAGHQSAAPVTLTTTADATHLVGLRLQFKDSRAPDVPPPSLTDFLIKLVAIALQEHPLLHALWDEPRGRIVVPEEAHVGFAVDTEAGLFVPVVRGPAALGIREIAARSRALIRKARARQLASDDMQGGTFTITNLGAFGVEFFTPILNLPQCSILGVGRVERRPILDGDKMVGREQMPLSLTFDHRVVDGAPAARFLQHLARIVAAPAPWLMS